MHTSKDMDDIYENIAEYNPSKECNRLIVFDNRVNDMLSNKKLQHIVTEQLIRGRKLFLLFLLHNFILLH